MAKVIDLQGRKKVKTDLDRSDKVEALVSLLRCNHCAMRCAKCGSHSEPTSAVTHQGTRTTFSLCESCRDEYESLLVYANAGPNTDMPFWYNREWVRQWMAWLEYQYAVSQYINSPEVLEAMTELEDY